MVVELSDRKEQQIYTFDSYTNTSVLYSSCVVPKVIRPVVMIEKTVNNKKVVISNDMENIKEIYP